MTGTFAYKAVLRSDDPSVITSMIAYQAPGDAPLRAVIWSTPHREWIYAPYIASRVLFDDMEQHRSRPVDRQTAEQIAMEILHTELPDETTLSEMSDEGERNGWNYGPPR
ncbi:hypothetical protein JIG36_15290 [Actinoplanes sp. LDG1-06]|uniref:Uncharacterized protein n=1 Tax=Paractinoplanes ovalisporus TaxID=2810368 RepID=A0ABS2AAS1_9ACTN|nr:hypothetical protein [Actinoplanes ovalisporus]MBM2616922.1 hypothetical protein [Actinoplanes ovalisporus]